MALKKLGRAFVISLIFLVVGGAGCGKNLLSEFGQKDTEAALTFQAKIQMDKGNWSDAINTIESLPASSLAKRSIIALRASAYAGRCGLDLISLLQSLTDSSATNSVLMIVLAAAKSDPNYADCKTAEDLLQTAGATADDRSNDENLLMTFASFQKMGAILAGDADSDGDGIADAGYSACGLSDALTNEMVVSLSLAARSLAKVDGVGGGMSSSISAVCGATTFCDNTETTDVDATERAAMRTAIHQNGDFGLHTSNGTVCP